MLLYQSEILKEAGLYQQALDHINENKSLILDKLSFLEMKGTFFPVLIKVGLAIHLSRFKMRNFSLKNTLVNSLGKWSSYSEPIIAAVISIHFQFTFTNLIKFKL